MSDGLRKRMAEVIHRTRSPLHDHGETVAQAIIDEFGIEDAVVDLRLSHRPAVVRHRFTGVWAEREEEP